MWAIVAVESDPATDASPCLRTGLPSVQVDAFIFQGPPETLDEDEPPRGLPAGKTLGELPVMEQTSKKKTSKPYSPEFRERAVRLAMEHRDEYQCEAARADRDRG